MNAKDFKKVLLELLEERYKKDVKKESQRRYNLPKLKALDKEADRLFDQSRKMEDRARRLVAQRRKLYTQPIPIDQLRWNFQDRLKEFQLRYDAIEYITNSDHKMADFNKLMLDFNLQKYKDSKVFKDGKK